MNILIVSGGSIDMDFALDFLKKHAFEYVIAVDKGAGFCLEAGMCPDILVGDFDTLNPEVLRYFEDCGIPIQRFRPEKDHTDIEIALGIAKEHIRTKGKHPANGNRMHLTDQVTILGGTGSRLDHMVGTLYCMAGICREMSCELVDAHNRVRVLSPGIYRLCKEECFGSFISLLPIGEDVRGLTLRGFKYPLTEHTMTCLDSLGISNELVFEEGQIGFREGLLACFETRD